MKGQSCLLLVVFLLLGIPSVGADALSSLPAAFADLQPLPEMDISGAEPRAREAINTARKKVAEALSNPKITRAELAEGYGRLGAYYDVYQIRSGAESCYSNAVTLDPTVFRWAFLYAYLAHASGRYEVAQERFRNAAAINPEYPSLGLFEAEIHLEFNQVEQAEPLLETAAEAEGLRGRAMFRLGQIALQERQFDEAVIFFRAALKADPEGNAVWFPLAQALRGSGDAEGARAALAQRGKQLPRVRDPLLEQLDALDQGSRPYYFAGLGAARKGDYVAAAAAFEQGLAQDSENPFARVSYARALYLSGRTNESREQLEIAEAQAPDETLPVFLLGLLDRAAADNDAAQARFEQVVASRPDHSGALYFLGLMAFENENYPVAAQRLDETLEAEPGNIYAKILGLVARQRSGVSELILREELAEIVAVSPGQWMPRYALARLLAASVETEVLDVTLALELSRQLVRLQAHPAVFEAMALAETAAGDREAAMHSLGSAETAYLAFGRFEDANRIVAQRARVDQGKLPGDAWPVDDPILSSPAISISGPFKEYPAARAY